jgi:hypothetical protein
MIVQRAVLLRIFYVTSKIFEAAKVWKNRQGKGLKD